LAALRVFSNPYSFGLELGESIKVELGSNLYTWGYPLGYNGPSPLLGFGYLSGYSHKNVDHLVINGAFNPGNSGGALLYEGKVIGVVQSKHAPIPMRLLSIISAMKNNNSGMMYNSVDKFGAKVKMSEGQLVSEVLTYFREMTQVMIGEAITVEELKDFMEDNNIVD